MNIRFNKLCAVASLVALLCMQESLGAAEAENREIGYWDTDHCAAHHKAGQEYCYLTINPLSSPTFFYGIPGPHGSRFRDFKRSDSIPNGWRLSGQVTNDLTKLCALEAVLPAEQRVVPKIEGLYEMTQVVIRRDLQRNKVDFKGVRKIVQQQAAIEERGRRRSQ